MMRRFSLKSYVMLPLLLVVAFNSFGQKDCPAIPVKTKFDTLGYIKASTPTDPSKGTGIWLGQGTVLRNGVEIRPGFIPTNRPSWAIAIAVAWNYSRNLIQRVEYPQIGYYMATLIQETELRCVTGLTWGDPSHVPNAYNPATVYAAQINNGCLQIEGPGSAYSALQQAYPNGRFPTNMYDPLIEGVDGFEASAMVKAYYDIYTSQIFNYNVGWDWYENVDCNTQQGDPYSYIKASGSNYNGGPNAYLTAEGIMNGRGCWGGFPATTANYGNDVAKWVSVFENDPGYCEYPAGSSFDSYYDDAVPWSEVEKYLDIIANMYPDLDFAGTVKPAVQATFNAQNGGAAINFTQFGDVIDAIVLQLPLEKPNPVEGSPMGIDLGCPGDILPYGHVDILDGATNMCLGQSVTLELTVDAGSSPDVTYRWFRGDPVSGTQIGSDKIITITPSAIGTEVYSGQICNSAGCYTVYSNTQNACQDPRNLNGFNVTTRDCNNCPFVASAVSTNSTCKGMTDGTVTVTLTNAPANYDVEITSNTVLGTTSTTTSGSGNTFTLPAVRDGSYNFVFTDQTDPNCVAYTSTIVGFTTDVNEYIEADLGSISNCVADVSAELKELPSPCNWRIEAFVPIFLSWENWVNIGVQTSTGIDVLSKWTDDYPAGTYDPWSPAQVYNGYMALNTGDQITFTTAVTPTPGAVQQLAYHFDLYDENDNLVYSTDAAAGAATFNNPFVAGSYTVTCPDNIAEPYTFSWSPSISGVTNTATTTSGQADQGNTPVQYVVTATNTNNPQCMLTDTVVVPGDPACNIVACTKPPYEILTPDTSVCKNDSAQIRLAFNGVAPYTLYYTPGSGQQVSVTGIATDVYSFNVGDAMTITIDSLVDADCVNDTAKTVTVTLDSIPSVFIGNDTTLCGNAYTLTALGNNIATHQWQENPANNQSTFGISASGEYRIEVASADGCIAWDTVNVTLNPAPIAPDLRDTAICAVATPFTLDATGVFDSYEWSDGSSNPTLNVSATGDYWVAVTVNGCSDTDSVAVTVSPGQALELGNDTAVCGVDFVLDARPGFATYQWNGVPADNGQTFTATTSGQYYVDVTTNDGCASSDTINLTLTPYPTVDLGSDTNYCSTNVPATYDATTAGATYEWNDASTNPTLDVSTTGDYWVIVTVNSCSDTDSVNVVVSGGAVLDLGADTTLCGDSLLLDAGVGFNSYSWNQSAVDTNQTLTITASGQYIVNVTTGAGCSGSDTINVTINPYPTAQISPTDPSDTVRACATSFPVTLDATQAGGTYEWNDASTNPTLDAAAQGDFWVIVTVNGCSDTDSVVVQQSTSLSLDLGPDTTICPGQSYTLRPNVTYSGVTFDWNNGASTDDSLVVSTAGEVTLQISANGCFGNDTMELFIDNPLSIALTDGSACEGDSVKLELSPARVGLNYAWNIGGGTISTDSVVHGSTLGTTTYTLDVDSAGCTASATADVTINALPTVNLGADTFLCVGAGATITLDAGAGMTTYTWQDGSGAQTLVASDSGTYHVTVLDANTCSSADTIRVDHQLATAFELGQDTTICPAGTATINLPTGLGGAGTSYVWEDGSSTAPYTISGQADGYSELVTLTYTNAFGCVSGDSLTVSVDNTLPVNGLNDTALCEGQSITFLTSYAGQLGYNYLWHDGTTAQNFPMNNVSIGDDQTVISVDITSDEGCSGSASATLTVNANPAPSLPDTTICLNESVVLDQGVTAAGHTFVWTASDNSVLPATATQNINGTAVGTINYSVTVVEDATTCSNDANGSVTVQGPPTYSLLGNSSGQLCVGEVVNLSTSLDTNVFSHQWSDSSGPLAETGNTLTITAQAPESDTYTVVVTQKVSQCTDTQNETVEFLAGPIVDFGSDSIIYLCEGEDTVFVYQNYDSSKSYEWNTGELNVDRITITEWGKYILTETVGACSHSDSIFVNHAENPLSYLGEDTIVCFEDYPEGFMTIDTRQTRASHLWSTGDTTRAINITETGTYSVEVISTFGCVTEDEITIFEDCKSNVWLATGFTPNGDGLNDVWQINSRGVNDFSIIIFNRWGEVVWQSSDKKSFWDGKMNGNPVAQDVYVYQLSYSYSVDDGSEETRNTTGHITVVR